MSEIEEVIKPRCVEIFITIYPDINAMKLELRMEEPTILNTVNILKGVILGLESEDKKFIDLGKSNSRTFMPNAEFTDKLNAQEKVIEAAKSVLEYFKHECEHGEYGDHDSNCSGCNAAKEALSQIAALEKK